jgi:hypothetical protein
VGPVHPGPLGRGSCVLCRSPCEWSAERLIGPLGRFPAPLEKQGCFLQSKGLSESP